mgnify:FL=1
MQTLNPVWNQTFYFTVSSPQQEIEILLLDHDDKFKMQMIKLIDDVSSLVPGVNRVNDGSQAADEWNKKLSSKAKKSIKANRRHDVLGTDLP